MHLHRIKYNGDVNIWPASSSTSSGGYIFIVIARSAWKRKMQNFMAVISGAGSIISMAGRGFGGARRPPHNSMLWHVAPNGGIKGIARSPNVWPSISYVAKWWRPITRPHSHHAFIMAKCLCRSRACPMSCHHRRFICSSTYGDLTLNEIGVTNVIIQRGKSIAGT